MLFAMSHRVPRSRFQIMFQRRLNELKIVSIERAPFEPFSCVSFAAGALESIKVIDT